MVLNNGQPVIIPATPTAPHFRVGLHQCPDCYQDIYVEQCGSYRTMFRDDESGRLHVA